MSVIHNINSILEELKGIVELIDYTDFQCFIDKIIQAKHIFLTGKGRSGLMISAFANRLMHLGFSVSFIGDVSSPHTQEGDLLIIGSGSGETESLISLASIAKKEKINIALLTTDAKSSLAYLANSVIVLPGASKLSGKSIQPMATAFEQLSLIVYDAIVLELMMRLDQTSDDMYKRHANLE